MNQRGFILLCRKKVHVIRQARGESSSSPRQYRFMGDGGAMFLMMQTHIKFFQEGGVRGFVPQRCPQHRPFHVNGSENIDVLCLLHIGPVQLDKILTNDGNGQR